MYLQGPELEKVRIQAQALHATFPDLTPRKICFQDDQASIHRTQKSMRAVERLFETRVKVEEQAPKMDDVWPIENVWGIVGEK